MVSDEKLSELLSDFAPTPGTEVPIQNILDRLVGRIVDVLPVTAAGVSLVTAGQAPRNVAASDHDALRFEELQTELGEGPCVQCFETGDPVAIEDLGGEDADLTAAQTLADRSQLGDQLDSTQQRIRHSGASLGLLCVHLGTGPALADGHLGKGASEFARLLRARLELLLRPDDTLARLSRNEFAILRHDLHDVGAARLAERVLEALTPPFHLTSEGDRVVTLTPSVGIACSQGNGSADQLVLRATIAMYQALRAGGGTFRTFDAVSAVRAALDDLDGLESRLRQALGANQLGLAYLPIARLEDGLIVGVEALLRWEDGSRGPVPALSMLGVAEQSELVVDIGAWVLQRGCEDRAGWIRDHPERSLSLTVNVSARQLMRPDFPESVSSVLTATTTDPGDLVLDMNEHPKLMEHRPAMRAIGELHALGVGLALDDFGTGLSSLSYLGGLPLDDVKLDADLVAVLDGGPGGEPIIAATINLAHTLGFTVTAEGVETETQYRTLIRLGCDFAQGVYVSPTLSADEIGKRLDGPETTLAASPGGETARPRGWS